MSIIISKRQLLKGLFATPALVAASSLMPIKPQASQIFSLESFKEIPTYNSWCLVREGTNGNLAWVKGSDVERFINDFNVIDSVKIPGVAHDFKGNNKLTVELMKIKSAQVIHEFPSYLTRSLIL